MKRGVWKTGPGRGRGGEGGLGRAAAARGVTAECLMVLVSWLLLAGGGWAAEVAGAAGPDGVVPAGRELKVGVMLAPPFLEKGTSGNYRGLSLDLWRDVAHDLGLTWRAEEYDLPGLLAAVRTGRVDVAVSDLSITPEREEVMDFSQPFYATGLGIAVPAKSDQGLLPGLVGRILSPHVLLYAGSLLALLLVVGTLVWLVERRRNPDHFRPGRKGIGDGLWWSAVTMTAVGYGDATPRTTAGRAVALVWMFASVTLLAFFTAGITTSLTVENMGDLVRGPEDLHKVRTGVKRDSSAEEALVAGHVGVARYASEQEGLKALIGGEIDAFVHDQPVLLYSQYHEFPGRIRVLLVTFDPQLYGFAFPPGSPLRKTVNVAMLRRMEDREYRLQLFGRYLGKGAQR